MRSNRKKRIFFWHISLCSLLVISLAALPFEGSGRAWAGEKKTSFLFGIHQQEITNALKEIAAATGYQLLFSIEQIGVQEQVSLSGHYTAEEALSLLLQDTGLSFEITARGVIVIKKDHPVDSEGKAMNNKNRFLFGFLGSLIGVGGVQEAVSAQTQDVERRRAEHALEEVVVTAQRREQSLQDVPVSVVALTEAELENLGIRNITDLAEGAVPNLRITTLGGTTRAHQVAIRGMQPAGIEQISREGTAGIYIDGVYLGRAQGLGMDQLDLERLEVLRGPQGTLFGRNTLGGAINMTSRKPTGELGLEQRLSAGNFGYFNSITRVNLPEVAGLSAKLDYMVTKRDGWVKNPARGQRDWNEQDGRGARLSVLWRPIDRFTLEYSYDRSTNRDVSGYQQIGRLLENAQPFPEEGFQQVESGRVSRGRTAALNEPMDAKVEGHSLIATWDITDNLTLKSISAYRTLDQFHFSNSAGSFFRPGPGTGNLFGRISLAEVEQEQYSQELQLQGSTDRVEYIAGYFYFKEEAEDANADAFGNILTANGPVMLPEPLFTRPTPSRSHEMQARSQALFGQLVWTPPVLDDRFHMTLGGRYNQDRKRGNRLLTDGSPTPMAFSYSENRFDPAITLSFDWSDTASSYLRWSTAFRGGGVNTRSDVFVVYDADEVESWELGLKSELWDRRLRLNAALFYTEWNDRQVDLGAPTVQSPTNSVTINTVETVKLQGVEMDMAWMPVSGLTLGLSYGYLEVDEPLIRNPFTGMTTQFRAVAAPRNTGTFSAIYDFSPLPFGSLQAFVGGKYTGAYYSSSQDPKSGGIPGYTLWDARLSLNELKIAGGELSVAFWGKNLFDKEYQISKLFILQGAPLLDAEQATFGTPRTFGLDVTYRY